MADYRSIQTRMWRSDEWFQELPTDARLFWIYLFTNPSARVAGIYRLPTKTMAFECGLPIERIEELKAEFAAAGKAYFERDVVWVVKMRELQTPGKISSQLQTGIDRDVAEIPQCELKTRYLIRYRYSIDTVPILSTTERERTQHNTETETAWAAALKAFEDNISVVSGSIADDMADTWDVLVMGNHSDWWEQAIKVSVERNKRSWSYMRGILQKCLQEGHPPSASTNGSGPKKPPKPERPDLEVELRRQLIAERDAQKEHHDAP